MMPALDACCGCVALIQPIADHGTMAHSLATNAGLHAHGGAIPELLRLDEAAELFAEAGPAAALGHSASMPWVGAWAGEVNAAILVAVWRHAGRPVMALPLEIIRRRGIGIARHVGGSHANANFPAVWQPSALPPSQSALDGLAQALGTARCGVDAIILERQLEEMGGIANPLMAADASPSPNVALHLELDAAFEAVLERHSGRRKRKRNRSQQRKFEAAGGYSIADPVASVDVQGVLEAYFAMKISQLAEKGVKNVFADHREQAFFKRLFANAGIDDPHRFGLSTLVIGGAIRAIFGWSQRGGRKTIHFAAFAKDELTAASPGDFLNYTLIERACAEGLSHYDLGVGDEPYKRSWCDIETWHRDSIVALTLIGRLEKMRLDAARGAKRFIKNSPPLWQAAQKLRKLRAGRQPAATAGNPDED
jgi:CelD/BcsL family acetyltransferase involved in cellulose biosynthesis